MGEISERGYGGIIYVEEPISKRQCYKEAIRRVSSKERRHTPHSRASRIITYGNEARRIFYEETSRHGLQLDFEITPKPQTVFVWGSLKLSQRSLYNPKAYIRMIIRHKLGYRTCFPGTYEWEKIAMLIAAANEIKSPQAFAYICADLFTAQALMSEMKSEQEKSIYIKAVLKDSYGIDPKPVWLIKSLVFKGLKNGIMDAENIYVPKDLYEISSKVLDVMMSSLPVINKLIKLAEILKPIIDENYGSSENLSQLPEIFQLNRFSKDSTAVALSQLPGEMMVKAMFMLYGKGDRDVIEFAPDPVVIEAERISLHNGLLASKKGVGEPDPRKYYGTWSIGDDPTHLLVKDTLRAFGAIFPPILSLKWIDGEKASASSCTSLGLALDVSYSMLSPPGKAARAKEAAYGLAEEAKLKLIDLTICYFNGSTLLKRYNTRYDEAQRDIASVIVGGQTNLLEAILLLGKEDLDTVIMITDAEVEDQNERKLITMHLEKMAEKKHVNIFMISDENQSWIEGGRWRTFQIKPGERFTEQALHLL